MLILSAGTKVEFFSKKVAYVGTWVCGEVIHSNVYQCTVKYGHGGEMVENPPRGAVRPCPPPLEVEADLLPGDVVEFHDWISWKTATFLKAVTEHDFLIRLVGESGSLVVNRSLLRPRQYWTGKKWRLLGNDSVIKSMEKRMYSCAKRKKCANCSPIKKNTRAQRRRLEDKPLLILDEDRRSLARYSSASSGSEGDESGNADESGSSDAESCHTDPEDVL